MSESGQVAAVAEGSLVDEADTEDGRKIGGRGGDGKNKNTLWLYRKGAQKLGGSSLHRDGRWRSRLVPLPFLNFSMAPRLLTILTQIETALVNQGSVSVSTPPSRSVSFHKGLARMVFADGSGSIVLQNFVLADGQICIRANFSWRGSNDAGTTSVYPREGFDWLAAADQIAVAWMAGPKTSAQVTETRVQESVAATGWVAGLDRERSVSGGLFHEMPVWLVDLLS
jgi:hypothetical protein